MILHTLSEHNNPLSNLNKNERGHEHKSKYKSKSVNVYLFYVSHCFPLRSILINFGRSVESNAIQRENVDLSQKKSFILIFKKMTLMYTVCVQKPEYALFIEPCPFFLSLCTLQDHS